MLAPSGRPPWTVAPVARSAVGGPVRRVSVPASGCHSERSEEFGRLRSFASFRMTKSAATETLEAPQETRPTFRRVWKLAEFAFGDLPYGSDGTEGTANEVATTKGPSLASEATGTSEASEKKPPLVVIVGPTAAGKSALALGLAQLFPAEIVSANSRQVYLHMDIGTAKPTREEQEQVPHHLVDMVEPNKPYTVTIFREQAAAAIAGIHSRDHVPLLVGGTGLYVRAITEGLQPPPVPPVPDIRQTLEDTAEREGLAPLLEQLQQLDPVTAARIDRRNPRRVVRALEVCLATGRPFSAQQAAAEPPYRILRIGLTCPRAELYLRIDARVDQMMADGLLQEVQRLVAMGYGFDLPSMSGIGYRQLGMYLQGKMSLAEAVQRLKWDTHRYARQQYTWFRLDDSRIHWLQMDPATRQRAVEEAAELVSRFLGVGFHAN